MDLASTMSTYISILHFVKLFLEVALSNHTVQLSSFSSGVCNVFCSEFRNEIFGGRDCRWNNVNTETLPLMCSVHHLGLYLVPTHFMYIFSNDTLDRTAMMQLHWICNKPYLCFKFRSVLLGYCR